MGCAIKVDVVSCEAEVIAFKMRETESVDLLQIDL